MNGPSSEQRTTRVARLMKARRDDVYREDTDTFHGRFLDLVPNERIVQLAEDNKAGSASSLAKLAELVETSGRSEPTG